MTVHRTILVTAAAGLLLTIGQTPAQAPPAGNDTEQRLKALEEKTDRILSSLENRNERDPATGSTAGIGLARDKVKAELAAKGKELRLLREKWPIDARASGKTSMSAEALAKYEAKRSELKIAMSELADQVARVEKVYHDGGPEKGNRNALLMIKTLGLKTGATDDNPSAVIVAQLEQERQKRRTTYGDNHPKIKEVDDAIAAVRKVFAGRENPDARDYLNVMKEEIVVMAAKIEALSNLIDDQKNRIRELNNCEMAEERIKRETDRLRNKLKVLEGLLDEDEGQRPK